VKLPAAILTVARNLGDLRERMVFVGGMVHELLVTDPAAPRSRPTKDVDVIVDVSSMAEMVLLGKNLRERGFREATGEDAHICGWVIEDVPVDVMPVDPAILGFTNVWYPGSLGHATTIDTSAGLIPDLTDGSCEGDKFTAYQPWLDFPYPVPPYPGWYPTCNDPGAVSPGGITGQGPGPGPMGGYPWQ